MSRFLSFECDWLDQPLTLDPVERRSWCCLRIKAAGRDVTRLWDQPAQAERSSIYIPAFPLARWMVANWWAILHEPEREGASSADGGDWPQLPEQVNWLRRHCLRAADSGLPLPRICMFSDGRRVVIKWSEDGLEAYPHMPGQFIGAGQVTIPISEVEKAFQQFITSVIDRVGDIPDERVRELKANWESLANSDAAEMPFCSAAGRLGLDPYFVADWDPALVELLESRLDEHPIRPILADLLDIACPSNTLSLWEWTESAESQFALEASPNTSGISELLPDQWSQFEFTAKNVGYRRANQIRSLLGHNHHLPDISDAALAIDIGGFAHIEYNHVPDAHVMGAIGWNRSKSPLFAGPRQIPEKNRFHEARALHHALFGCQFGARLITDAKTWEQRASRTFAAELLAPRSALTERYRNQIESTDSDSVISDLAIEYQVSTMVITHQLENAGISPGDTANW